MRVMCLGDWWYDLILEVIFKYNTNAGLCTEMVFLSLLETSWICKTPFKDKHVFFPSVTFAFDASDGPACGGNYEDDSNSMG